MEGRAYILCGGVYMGGVGEGMSMGGICVWCGVCRASVRGRVHGARTCIWCVRGGRTCI